MDDVSMAFLKWKDKRDVESQHLLQSRGSSEGIQKAVNNYKRKLGIRKMRPDTGSIT
jgi:hypothetical protein